MFTADDARAASSDDLDRRLQDAVRGATGRSASIRVYAEDWFRHSIERELESRGFTVDEVPDFVLKGDVRFSW